MWLLWHLDNRSRLEEEVTQLCSSMQGLKSHAVTMFEVGKLTDESLDSFLGELEKASIVSGTCFRSFLSVLIVTNVYVYVLFNYRGSQVHYFF